jgi:hypothetical protein
VKTPSIPSEGDYETCSAHEGWLVTTEDETCMCTACKRVRAYVAWHDAQEVEGL